MILFWYLKTQSVQTLTSKTPEKSKFEHNFFFSKVFLCDSLLEADLCGVFYSIN